MYKKEQIIQQVIEQGLLPLYYQANKAVCIDLLKALYAAGIRSVEYTNRGEGVFTGIEP